MNHFERVHELVGQRRQDSEDDLLPVAAQRTRISELEGALRALIKAGDGLRLPVKEMDGWHAAALAAEAILNSSDL